MIFRRCPNCHKLYQGKRCMACACLSAKTRQKKNEALKVYSSRRWEKVREVVRAMYFDYDIWLLGAGQIYHCDHPLVHHIQERDEAPELIYDIDNLITVSHTSHEEIHKQYLEDKPAALARIKRGKEEFRRLFG